LHELRFAPAKLAPACDGFVGQRPAADAGIVAAPTESTASTAASDARHASERRGAIRRRRTRRPVRRDRAADRLEST
jgi:hypothetical protein